MSADGWRGHLTVIVTVIIALVGVYEALRHSDEMAAVENARQAQQIADIMQQDIRDREELRLFRDEVKATLNRIAERCPVIAPQRN